MSREEAAAKAMVDQSVKWQTTDAGELAKAALAAADAVMLSDAGVERTAERSWNAFAERDGGRPWSKIGALNQAAWAGNVKAVLAAAVEAGQ